MKAPKELAAWKGSEKTFAMVAEQIAERWGEEEAENYNPDTNCFTFNRWISEGYCVRKGEKALKSITYIVTEDEAGEKKKFPRTVCLFYYKQVEPLKAK